VIDAAFLLRSSKRRAEIKARRLTMCEFWRWYLSMIKLCWKMLLLFHSFSSISGLLDSPRWRYSLTIKELMVMVLVSCWTRMQVSQVTIGGCCRTAAVDTTKDYVASGLRSIWGLIKMGLEVSNLRTTWRLRRALY